MAEAQQRILYVEDTSDTRDLVEFTLRQEGLEITSVETAEEGLGLVRKNSYALILLDVGLPELCRYQVRLCPAGDI